jgi:hypothetical protein
MQCGLNTECLCRTLHTVVFYIDSSLTAVTVDFFELCRKLARTCSTPSSAVNGRPLDFCLHRHPVSVNCLYHARMVLSVGGSFAYFARNARCTVTTDLLLWYSNTQNDFSPGVAIIIRKNIVDQDIEYRHFKQNRTYGWKNLCLQLKETLKAWTPVGRLGDYMVSAKNCADRLWLHWFWTWLTWAT